MNITTFNVNSIRARLERFTEWLDAREPDVVCLQELKCTEAELPRQPLEQRGYHLVISGQKTYNGVGILSRRPLTDVRVDLPWPGDPQARGISAVVDGLRVVNLYVVNGESITSDKYSYKLEWLRHLHEWLAALSREGGGEGALAGAWGGGPTVVCGDFNIAPADQDVYDPKGFAGQVLCTEAERDAFRGLLGLGLHDALRHHQPDGPAHTWWDYRGNGFGMDHGLRIDHFLVSKDVLDRSLCVSIDRDARGRPQASDHAPVTLHLRG